MNILAVKVLGVKYVYINKKKNNLSKKSEKEN